MKKFGVFLISLYQVTLSPIFIIVFGPRICRYNPSCSMYTKQQIERYGLIKGLVLGAKRLSTCHPLH